MSQKTEEILEQLKSLTLLEASELVEQLEKVFGVDAFGNVNQTPSEISFEVRGQTSLSSFLPYPSPFSSEMRFAYQMSGSKQPDNLKIQILNSTGNLVYEATQVEIGDLVPGSNLTNWVYKGVDMKGNLLPNGVYLYKVILSDSEINHLETTADKSFKDGWGSFMIVR